MHKNLLRFILPHAQRTTTLLLAASCSQLLCGLCNCISVCRAAILHAAYATLFMAQMWLAAAAAVGVEHLSALKYATHFFYATTFLTLVVARAAHRPLCLLCWCGIMKISSHNHAPSSDPVQQRAMHNWRTRIASLNMQVGRKFLFPFFSFCFVLFFSSFFWQMLLSSVTQRQFGIVAEIMLHNWVSSSKQSAC